MAVNVPDVSAFDREDLRLSPEMHHLQAEMAAERGEEYDPVEFEEGIDERRDQWPDLDDPRGSSRSRGTRTSRRSGSRG